MLFQQHCQAPFNHFFRTTAMSVIKDVKLVWKGKDSVSVVAVKRKRKVKVTKKTPKPSIDTTLRVVKVFRAGKKNATVETNTGIRVKVPLELGHIDMELDEKRIGALLYDGSYNYYLTLNSNQYKCKCIDNSKVSSEQQKTFCEIAKASLIKLMRKGRVRRFEFKTVYEDFIQHSWDRGTLYRFSQKPKKFWSAYVYTTVEGYLKGEFWKKVEERKREVSFDYLASINKI